MDLIEKILKLFSLFIFIACSGCPVAYLLSDPIVYRIEGEVYCTDIGDTNHDDKFSMRKISSVVITMCCPDSNLTNKTVSDDNGYFVLRGRGSVSNCELYFIHSDFKPKVIRLDPKEVENPNTLSKSWKLKVKLEHQ